jgi:hypothetical protein
MEEAFLNQIADLGSTLLLWLSVANGGGQNNELAVDRRQVNWSPAVGGVANASNEVTFNIPAGSTVNHVQFWSAANGGTYYGSAAVTQEVFGGSGTYVLETAEIRYVGG